MTNEEAITVLKQHHMWTGEPEEIVDVRKENKALEMAIKALKQYGALQDIRREVIEQSDECADRHGCTDEIIRIIDNHLKEIEE